MIIDDEVLVRVGLKTTIDWEKIGFTVIGEAANGEQGYEQYKKHNPEVIITDIKMPKRDGLWLIEKIKKENQDVKILVLTCYDEFLYARKALKLGAQDYILKSEVEDEELISIMKSLKDKMDAQFKRINIQKIAKINQNDIKRSLLNDIIKADFIMDDKLIERCATLDFPIYDTKFAFLSIVIDEDKTKKAEKKSQKQIHDAILNIIFERLADKEIEYIYDCFANKYVFFMSSSVLDLTDLKRSFIAVDNAARQYFDTCVSIVYTNIFDHVDKCIDVYKDFIEKAQIVFYETDSFLLLDVNDISFKEANIFDLRKEYNTRFNEYIGQENITMTNELVYEVSEYFRDHHINPKEVKLFYSNLVGDIFSSYGELLKEYEEILHYEIYHYKIINAESLKSITNLLLEFISKVIEGIGILRGGTSKLFINRALNYIESNYDQKLSLEDVAASLNISKHYLCSMFRKETGETITTYINKLKIEKAKKLLLNTEYRTKEIYERVGYSNQQYFSKVFKKITGMTIMEYRNQVNKKPLH